VSGRHHVIVVGGGFAGITCARKLARDDDVHVTLIDRDNYHQFQPLLYQVATCQLAATESANSLRQLFHRHRNVDVKLAEVVAIDTDTRTVTAADGHEWRGDAVVLATGSVPNFFGTPGADVNSFPLYSLDDAARLRSRILRVFEDADREPHLLDRGALNFVVVGGGPTGVEVAGALGDMIRDTMSVEFEDLAVDAAQVHIVDAGPALLSGFSDTAHDYAARVLRRKGVQLHMGVAVTEVESDCVKLADGTTIATRCAVWGGGLMAGPLGAAADSQQGDGSRIDVRPDLTVGGTTGIYAVGDMSNIPAADGQPLPQLASVAVQSGAWAARNILADFSGTPRRPFRYIDKGIMAMIGRGAAIAELGARRREFHGVPGFAAWLAVHAFLLTGARNRIHALVDWTWDYFTKTRGPQLLDRSDAPPIDWGSEPHTTPV
jgi:NADH:ubiquinone reductase (H+-translocating)